jgi:HEAT repeat protein
MAKTLELRPLEPDLAQACKRLLAREIADRGCIAKRLVLDTLVTFEAHVPDVYLEGLRYHQMEHSFGPPEDTAGSVRGLCAHALVRIDYPDAILEVAPLLYDDLPEVRLAAAEALASTGEQTCAAILHVRIMGGETAPEAMEAMYRGLLALAPKRYLPVVGAALSEGEEAAALALGESRLPAAFPVLQSALEKASGDLEATVLLGIGLLRMEEATAYLKEVVEKAPENRAVKAIEALALHRHDTRIADRIAEIVKTRKSKKLTVAFAEKFGGNV